MNRAEGSNIQDPRDFEPWIMCVYIYTYVYIYVHMYICICTYMYIYVYVYIYTYIYICIDIYIYIYACNYLCTQEIHTNYINASFYTVGTPTLMICLGRKL